MEPLENIAFLDGASDEPISAERRGVFLPEEVLKVFNVNFLDYEFARMWVLKRLHPHGAYCPGCGAAIPEKKLRRFWSNGRLSCRGCGKYFTALTGTFIAGCQLDFRGLIILAFLLALGVHDKEIARITEMSRENVRLWRLKFTNLGFQK
ncbi:MAG TPA: hypothetical protein DDY86_02540 [Syntrophaceae bacterium]|nr:hypothetical protein [Syntrophaceae bacterium]